MTAIAAGYFHSLFLKRDGTVVAWGGNRYGEGTVPLTLTGVVAIAANGYHNLALIGNGTGVAWGKNTQGESAVPVNLNGVVAIAAGAYHSLALRRDGLVFAWGDNTSGQTEVPSNLSGAVAISAGETFSLALRRHGLVFAWGNSGHGAHIVPTGLNGVVEIAAGPAHAIALRRDGTVVAWGFNGFGQTNVPPGLSQVVSIAAGGNHSLALVNDGAPSLFRQPISLNISVGTTAVWDVGVSGARPLHYEWRKDGSTITGQTNSVLFVPSVQLSNSGSSYAVVVTNAAGSITSQVAVLTVQLPTYTVMVATSGSGAVVTTPQKPRYVQGEVVEITAVPTRWYAFSQWNDGVTDTHGRLRSGRMPASRLFSLLQPYWRL